ncbi:MAG: DNA polymerase III subunit delta [Gammaproteobacteria bacterium]|nr:DNA polymerase III subunit delta [Gammaproteobacteria bacterium]
MKLRRPEDLEARLADRLDPVYLISGDEPLLVQEAADAVRAAAKAAGVEERQVFHVEAGFDWNELMQSANSLSLFASRRLVEMRCGTGMSAAGGKVLEAYAGHLPEDDILLILMPRLERRTENTKWYKALDAVGVHLPVWPLDLAAFPRWLGGRLRRAGVQLEPGALDILVARVEGNPLAASQAVTRLALAEQPGAWSADQLLAFLDDDSRYNPFELADAVLVGDAEHAHRMLATLRQEGVDALAIVGTMAWSLRQVRTLLLARERGENVGSAMGQMRLIPKRKDLLERSLPRLSLPLIEGSLRDLAVVDQAVKGMVGIEPWDELDRLCLRLAGVRTTPLGVRARAWLE